MDSLTPYIQSIYQLKLQLEQAHLEELDMLLEQIAQTDVSLLSSETIDNALQHLMTTYENNNGQYKQYLKDNRDIVIRTLISQ